MIVLVECYIYHQPTSKDKKKYDTKRYLSKKMWLNFHLLRFSDWVCNKFGTFALEE